MSTEVNRLLAQSAETLAEARLLLEGGFPAGAVSRAYYAIFHAAEAMLVARGLDFASHHAVIAAFGREFARTGEVDPEYHRMLRLAFEERQGADYGASPRPTPAEASQVAEAAEQFLSMARDYLTP